MEDLWPHLGVMQHRAVLRDIGANRKWHFPTFFDCRFNNSIPTKLGYRPSWICLHNLQNIEAQDIWFLLFISAIEVHLRLFGEQEVYR